MTSHTLAFESEVPQNLQFAIQGMISTMRRDHRKHAWIGMSRRRVLIQSTYGRSPGFVATVHDVSRRQSSTSTGLSPRQLEVAEYACSGATATEIASVLEISVHTVRQHLKETYRRLNVGNRLELNDVLAGRRTSSLEHPH